MAPLILQGMGVFSICGAKPSPILPSSQLMYRILEMFCSVRWAFLLLALLEWQNAGRVGQTFLGQCRKCTHSCEHIIGGFLVGEIPTLALVWVQRNTVRFCAQWYVVHSHERCLAGSLIDDGD
jgi:hypothetical protein